MASGREHMASNHGQERSHWSEFGKGLRNVATHLRTMHKESGTAGECKPADEVDKLANLAISHSNYHGEQVEACMKAANGNLMPLPEGQPFLRELIIKMIGEAIGNTVVPTNVSAVTPNRPRIAAIPSARQPLNAAPVKPNVPLEFEKMFAIDDE
jgi:hypothetical protein